MTVVASANILYTLPGAVAATALDSVLAEQPDLVALQEWYWGRLGTLRRWGGVRLATLGVLPAVPVPAARAPRYHWVATVDGNVVGARADRYDLVRARAHLNIWPAPSEREDRFLRTEPPRFVAVGVFRDLRSDKLVTLLSYHLSAGVQSRGSYRSDRPRLAARHRHEVTHLGDLVTRELGAGHAVHAAGDSNFDGMQLPGLTSAWAGRESEPGTHGRGKRKIDDVFGAGPATEVRRIATASDHQAILVTRPD
jgi:hypothetical protein